MERWGRLVARRRWVVLVAGLLTTLAAAAWGLGVFGSLSDGGFDDPGSESARADAAIVDAFGQIDADILVLYTSEDGVQVDDPAFEQAVNGTVDALPADDVVKAVTTYGGGGPGLVSKDGTATLVPITLAGAGVDERQAAYDRIRPDLEAPGLSTDVGGPIAVFSDVGAQVEADIARAESLTIPLVVLLSLFIFGSLVSATLPALVGGIAIMGSFALLRLFTTVTDVSIFAINVITLLGVGLAIDYALFVVSRFREELASGHSTPDAVTRTMATAGRTVMFSGLTVAVSLASLLLFPQVFLRSMGFGGMAAVLVAMVTALTVLPALLAVLGPKVDGGRMPWRRRRAVASVTGALAEHGAWARIARVVMRRPVVVLTTVVVGLLALGLPFLRVEWTGVDERVLPAGTESRVVSERLSADFPGQDLSHAEAVVSGADPGALQTYASALGAVDGVADVSVTQEGNGTTLYDVSYAAIDNSAEGRALVEGLRAVPVPDGAQALIGGQSAQLVDLLASLAQTLPWMGLMVVLAMLVLLFLAFGSVVLPLKAVVVNAISVVASFGVVVWIFQDGHLADFLGFTPLGALDATQPILMLAILFGLSMDYEVFLLSRIREQWDRGVGNTTAVAVGLQKTGSIITSAALLLAVVIGAFATSGVTFIKMIGVGMLVAILVDATVVRTLLVPAAMRLMGRANWWAPAPLARWWRRYGLHETPTPAGDPAADHGSADVERPLLLTR
ncbi:MAG: MMPL family transporter [Geodermatophilaceae bacterium]|nr:MMPL family transporter [Geodermatophilaceae bacterium]